MATTAMKGNDPMLKLRVQFHVGDEHSRREYTFTDLRDLYLKVEDIIAMAERGRLSHTLRMSGDVHVLTISD